MSTIPEGQDGRPVDDTERTTIDRGCGHTQSELYLQRLCERSFLKFWSHPRVFQDNGLARSGEGKELCDLLVVFGNDILIFSDKHCAFPSHDDPFVAWTRWYKRAVEAGAKQIFGAERRIKNFPDQLFLDAKCRKPFPLPLPPPAAARFHRIVVAHGASSACKAHFGSSGSLMLDTGLRGDAHVTRNELSPQFTIGQISPEKGYVHVFDDDTLDIVMNTLDTVADFVAYLSRKEAMISGPVKIIATGEEQLLALYLKQVDDNGEHNFILPPNINGLCVQEGHWEEFCVHPQRIAQLQANRVSYIWDELIEKFSHHIMNGTQQFTTSEGPQDSERGLRFLAAEGRTRRRMLAQGILKVVRTANSTQRFVRVYQSTKPPEPHYVFLSLPSTHAKSEEEYREVRRRLLETYCFVCKRMYPDAIDIVGLAISPTSETSCSEDLLYFDARQWTPEQDAEAAALQIDLKILQGVESVHGKYSEYPDVKTEPTVLNRVSKRFPRNAACPCGSGMKFKKCCGR